MNKSKATSSANQKSAAAKLPPIRILLVDAHSSRRAAFRSTIETAGYEEPECATSGDEALDVLGAKAQQFDVVVAWLPLPDDNTVDLPGVLRRNNSPVRLIVLTDYAPRDYPRAGRLAGCAGVEGKGGERAFIRLLQAVAKSSTTTVASIVASRQAPATLAGEWCARIYGVPPGGRFQAKID